MENGYYGYLRGLLLPLGVYDQSGDSYNMAELRALGQALDEACTETETLERECFLTLAQTYGLDSYEAILPKCGAETLEERRNAVIAMMSVNGQGTNLGRIDTVLAGCPDEVELTETSRTQVTVSFTGTAPTGDRLTAVKSWIERLLPCHLTVEYDD